MASQIRNAVTGGPRADCPAHLPLDPLDAVEPGLAKRVMPG